MLIIIIIITCLLKPDTGKINHPNALYSQNYYVFILNFMSCRNTLYTFTSPSKSSSKTRARALEPFLCASPP